MVIVVPRRPHRSGALIIDVMVAMAILTIAVLPVACGFRSDVRSLRATYQQAVAMEIVDGELEILAAGAWRGFSEGSNAYSVRANAATNLPPGQFVFTRQAGRLRLEWMPAAHSGVGRVVREITVK